MGVGDVFTVTGDFICNFCGMKIKAGDIHRINGPCVTKWKFADAPKMDVLTGTATIAIERAGE